MSSIGNISIRLKLREEEVGSYKGKHSLSCNCQPPEPTPRARINWILEEETLGKREVVLKSQEKNVRELGMVEGGEMED